MEKLSILVTSLNLLVVQERGIGPTNTGWDTHVELSFLGGFQRYIDNFFYKYCSMKIGIFWLDYFPFFVGSSLKINQRFKSCGLLRSQVDLPHLISQKCLIYQFLTLIIISLHFFLVSEHLNSFQLFIFIIEIIRNNQPN